MSKSPPRTLRVAVAGLGFGAAVHAPALIALPGVELVGIAGRDAARAQAAADALGIKGYGSIRELLALKPDAITLALPPDQVADAVGAAFDAGVDVLCEKPLGTDAKIADELVKRATDRITAMDFIFGELETFGRLKQLIDSKTYGKVSRVKVEWFTHSWAYRSRNWSWKTDAAQGGGVISLLGSHLFFLAEWLLGPAVSVHAQCEPPLAAEFAPPGARAAEDSVQCMMKHAGGTIFQAAFSNAREAVPVHRWSVEFEKATVVLENIGSDYIAGFTLSVTGQSEKFSETKNTGDGRIAPFSRLAQRFLNAVRTRQKMYPDIAVGARVQHLDAAARESIVSGKDVAIA